MYYEYIKKKGEVGMIYALLALPFLYFIFKKKNIEGERLFLALNASFYIIWNLYLFLKGVIW